MIEHMAATKGDLGQPVLLRVEEAAVLLRLSRSRLFEMISRDEVPGVLRFGRSTRISRVALERWIEEQVGPAA